MEMDIPNSADQNILPLTTFQSDDLLEKLKFLNYEKNLLSELKMKPLSRFYFVKSTNPGEQFYMFTLICWWLCQKLGKNMQRPQEYDDPNDVIARIVAILEEIDVDVDFTPNKLIRGAGPNCIFVLDSLATQAIKVMKVSCQRLHITQEDEIANDYLEDNAEIILERIEDEQNEAISDDDNSELDLNQNSLRQWGQRKRNHHNHHQHQLMSENEGNSLQVTDKLTDQQTWRLEFEQVMPHLKVYVRSDVRDWRAHMNQMEALKTTITEATESTQLELKKLHNEFTFSLEKIESREKHLNNELHNLVIQYKDVSIELSNIQYAHNQVLEETERSVEQLKAVIAENDNKKAEMERRGQMMSDSSFVMTIKKAVAKLKDDVAHLNLEVSLLVNGIDREILKRTGPSVEIEKF
ncbi:intraflagellar transport protein 57 homolog [Stomoxys calcitrans]|uniref:Intraflagellar transport 57 n=1 Tax=Stomoxys calcitrans TaxID=35570 RepID=A0A1I8PGE3_STOCA|nr:intraflagellar transport protein 57 homolog [Stomoxys calcitrans]